MESEERFATCSCTKLTNRLQEVLEKLAEAEFRLEEMEKANAWLKVLIDDRDKELHQKSIALKEVLGQLEVEKRHLAENVEVNIHKLLLPVIDRLIEKSSSLDSRYLLMLRQNLQRLTSSAGIKLASTDYNLTPREIELCALIKGGFSIKEIATMHNLSERTVETHRLNIRRKLGLSSAKINLSSYLSQL